MTYLVCEVELNKVIKLKKSLKKRYVGLNLTNHKNRKLGVFDGKLGETTPKFLFILIRISKKLLIMFRRCLLG